MGVNCSLKSERKEGVPLPHSQHRGKKDNSRYSMNSSVSNVVFKRLSVNFELDLITGFEDFVVNRVVELILHHPTHFPNLSRTHIKFCIGRSWRSSLKLTSTDRDLKYKDQFDKLEIRLKTLPVLIEHLGFINHFVLSTYHDRTDIICKLKLT